MNFAGFQKIIANTAAHIDRAVADKVSEVTGPKALNEYDIGDQVGSGGPGLLWKLFRAKPKSKAQQELSAEVCVWFLDKKSLAEDRSRKGTSKSAEDALLEIFRSDAKLLQKLRHPGVVRVVDALEETKGAMAMVTEPLSCSVANALGNYSNIEKVTQELEDLELGQLEVKHGVLQLTETLSFLHTQAKLVHRSISPETVFLTTTGGWKFGGFGFSALVSQISNEEAPSFHYPEYDVDSPALPLQPLLDYSAPELVQKQVQYVKQSLTSPTAMDIFSLATLTYHLVVKKPLFNCYNNQNTYMNRVSSLQRDPLQGISMELEGELRRMLNQDASLRPTAQEFGASAWFREDIRVRALRFLDHIIERDNMQKSEFFKSLNGLWSGFDPRVLRYKVLPPLLLELKNEAILPFILPLILHIAENQTPNDFELYTQPALLPVYQNSTGETLLILVKNQPLLVSKSSAAVTASHLVPLLIRAYEDSDPRVQEETLRRTKELLLKLDFDLVRAAVLPRVHALALKTSVAAVRVQALLCLAELAQRLDRSAILDVLQTCARCAAVDHSAPTLMCVLAVCDIIEKQQGLEFAAEHLLPLLTPLLITQQLSGPQFAKLMRFVLDILHKIEEKRGVNASEADSDSLDFAGLTLNSASNPETDLFSSAPSKPAQSKTGSTWDAMDDWGPLNATPPSNNVATPVTALAVVPKPQAPEFDFMGTQSLPPSVPEPSLADPFGLPDSKPSPAAPRAGLDMAHFGSIAPADSLFLGSAVGSTVQAPLGSAQQRQPQQQYQYQYQYQQQQQQAVSLSGLTTQPSSAMYGSLQPSAAEEEDPFADWPLRTTANSMLAPGGSTPAGVATVTAPANLGGYGQWQSSANGTDLDDFFSKPHGSVVPQQQSYGVVARPAAGGGRGGFFPPPPGSSPGLQGVGRGRGAAQSQSGQSSILDLL